MGPEPKHRILSAKHPWGSLGSGSVAYKLLKNVREAREYIKALTKKQLYGIISTSGRAACTREARGFAKRRKVDTIGRLTIWRKKNGVDLSDLEDSYDEEENKFTFVLLFLLSACLFLGVSTVVSTAASAREDELITTRNDFISALNQAELPLPDEIVKLSELVKSSDGSRAATPNSPSSFVPTQVWSFRQRHSNG